MGQREAEAMSAFQTYVIQAEAGGPIKIGKATDVMGRLRDLQVGYPFKLVLLGTIEIEERDAHRALNQSRLSGEWFAVSEQTIAFLSTFGITPRQEQCPSCRRLRARNQQLIRLVKGLKLNLDRLKEEVTSAVFTLGRIHWGDWNDISRRSPLLVGGDKTSECHVSCGSLEMHGRTIRVGGEEVA